jgi:hypothetical protein
VNPSPSAPSAPPPGEPAGTPPGGTRSRSRADHSARLDGDVLIVRRDTSFPSVCIKCASHQGIERRATKFQWTPMWARMSVVFCALPGLIAIAITTKRAELQLPLCPACNKRWTAARNALIAGVIAIVLSLVALRLGDDPQSLLPLIGVVIIAFVVVALAYVKPRMLQVRKIDDAHVELKNCHPGAAQEIAEGSS